MSWIKKADVRTDPLWQPSTLPFSAIEEQEHEKAMSTEKREREIEEIAPGLREPVSVEERVEQQLALQEAEEEAFQKYKATHLDEEKKWPSPEAFREAFHDVFMDYAFKRLRELESK